VAVAVVAVVADVEQPPELRNQMVPP